MTWTQRFTERIRISLKNKQRIQIVKGDKSMAAKLDEILNLYFENRGGELERTKLEDNIKNLN